MMRVFVVFALFFGLLNGFAYGFSGFYEAAYGFRPKENTAKHSNYNLTEARVQIKDLRYLGEKGLLYQWGARAGYKFEATTDFFFDTTTDFFVRELYVTFSPFDNVDIKAGRQVLTWGTGDYLFINDMFPKDYVSFFIGRDDEYLKLPSDAVKVSVFGSAFNYDVVLMRPKINITAQGERLTYFDPFKQAISGRESDIVFDRPDNSLENIEGALRVYKNINGYEYAAYIFRGYDKNPTGMLQEGSVNKMFYPRVNVYGASLRGQVASGIGNIEFGYIDAVNDGKGNNRNIRNSYLKLLLGYEIGLKDDLTVGLQYQLERMLDYANYKDSLFASDVVYDEYRHLVTLRVNKAFLSQTLNIGCFTFFSPSDEDVYLRPYVSYDISDALNLSIGANLIYGKKDFTEFGQMEHNSNVYFRLRYSF